MSFGAYFQRSRRAYYGWRMVALGGFLSSLNKTAVNKGFPVFVLPIEQAFGLDRAQVSILFSLARAESGFTGPLDGWLVDRFGPRLTLFLGTLLVGIGFLLLGFVPNVWAFGVVYLGVITTGSTLGFSYSMAALVNNWFQRQKGLAMSTYQAVDSFLPALLVPVMALSIAVWGWQLTSTVLGIILLGIIIPLSFFIRNSPESMGLPMDGVPRPPQDQVQPSGGRPAGHAAVARAAPPDEYTVAAAMRTPSYWVLVTATALRLVAKGAITVHIIPILVSKGVDAKTAAFIFGLLLFVSVPFYFGVGWLSDRHPKRLVMAVACASGTASFALLALPLHSLWPVFLFVFLFAIADASAPINWALLGDYFGTKTFSTLRGYVQMANFPGVFLAPVFVGWWYKQHQNYTLPLWIFTAVFALGAVTFLVTRQPRRLGSQAAPVGREVQG